MEPLVRIKKTLTNLLEISNKKRITNPSDFYRLDRYGMQEYLFAFPKWRKKIINYFNDLHQKGEKVICVDICGRATGEKIYADKSYCFSFKNPKDRQDWLEISNTMAGIDKHEAIFSDGDLFDPKDFTNFINILKKEKSGPALVTFFPVAGLQSHTPKFNTNEKEVVYGLLGKRLKQLIEVMRPGGYLVLERPFQLEGVSNFSEGKPQNKWDISLQIKKISRKLKCKVEISSHIGGPYFLIQK